MIRPSLLAVACGATEHATVWHLLESSGSGLANKDAGNFEGDREFIEKAILEDPGLMNPEARIHGNVIEMLEVDVTAWGEYVPCNVCKAAKAPFPCIDGYWCCASQSESSLPGKGQVDQSGSGLWYSFPAQSEGRTWNQTLKRRIQAECMVRVWRDDGDCTQCADLTGQCMYDCISAMPIELKHNGWERVFADQTLCPDVAANLRLPFSPLVPSCFRLLQCLYHPG